MNGSTTLGITSSVIVPENPHRRKLVIVNISDTLVHIGQGIAALNTGIGLYPRGVMISEPDTQGYIYQGAWSGISSAATKVVSWYQEEYP